MTKIELTIYVLALVGVGACGISGAAAAIRKKLDLFGVMFVAAVTGLGGGIIRDILLSNLPPSMFQDPAFIIVSALSSLVIFLIAHFFQHFFQQKHRHWDFILNFIDAVGLGAFTVLGINTALSKGFQDNAFFLVFIGMTTGIGGGILRDILLDEIPSIFTKHVYAIATIAGAVLYVTLYLYARVEEFWCVLLTVVTVTVLRVLAAIFRWNFPKAYK